MPEVYEDPSIAGDEDAGSPPVRPYRPPNGPTLPPENSQSLVGQMTMAAQRSIDIFRTAITDRMVRLAPDTTFWNAIERNDEATSYVVADVVDYAAEVFGDENLAANVDAELIGDPFKRAATIQTLQWLSQNRPGVPVGELQQLNTAREIADELWERYQADPSSYDEMSLGERSALSQFAGD